MTPMKKCFYCGYPNEEKATHCEECGTKMIEQQAAPTKRKTARPLIVRILQPLFWLTCSAAAITFWLLLSGQPRTGRVALDGLLIFAFTCYLLFPFDPRRIRAAWAKHIMTLSGLVGVMANLVRLVLHLGWLIPTKHIASNVHLTLIYTNWLLLLAIFALIVSGQLLGIKNKDHETEHGATD
jgi:hypothetical protein